MARRGVLEGFPGKPGRTLLQQARSTLDEATRAYLVLKDEGWGADDVEMAKARGRVRGAAAIVGLIESPYDPMVLEVEKMSVRRVRTGKVRKHICGGLILVGGMCSAGHDPSGH